MNAQEKVSRIYVFIHNLDLMSTESEIIKFTDSSSFLTNVLAKHPAGYSPKGSWEYKKKKSWTYEEAVLLEETLLNHVYSDLALPFLKDTKLMALVDKVMLDERAHNYYLHPESYLDITPNRFYKPQGVLKDLCRYIGNIYSTMKDVFDNNILEIDDFFKHATSVYINDHAVYTSSLYRDMWYALKEKPSLCLSSIPETDFDANYTEALKSIKNN